MGKQIVFIQDPGMGIGQTDSVQTQKDKGPEMARLLILLKQWTKKSKFKKRENKKQANKERERGHGLRDC